MGIVGLMFVICRYYAFSFIQSFLHFGFFGSSFYFLVIGFFFQYRDLQAEIR